MPTSNTQVEVAESHRHTSKLTLSKYRSPSSNPMKVCVVGSFESTHQVAPRIPCVPVKPIGPEGPTGPVRPIGPEVPIPSSRSLLDEFNFYLRTNR